MKVLVTSDAGFIGSAIIRHIIKNIKDSVGNIDKFTYADNLESLTEIELSNRYAFQLVGIFDPNELE